MSLARLALALLMTGGSLACAGEAAFPFVRQGDIWTYKQGDIFLAIEVMGLNSKGETLVGYTMASEPPDSSRYIRNVSEPLPASICVGELLTRIVVLQGKRCAKRLHAGESWTVRWKSGETKITDEFRFTGFRDVESPAGKFKVHVFEVDQHFDSPKGEASIKRTYFYSPEVRGMVYFGEQDFQGPDRRQIGQYESWLQKFTPGPEVPSQP